MEQIPAVVLTAALTFGITSYSSRQSRAQSLSDAQRHKLEDLAQALESLQHAVNGNDFESKASDVERFVERVDRHEFETPAIPRYLADELSTLRQQSSMYVSAATAHFPIDAFPKEMLASIVVEQVHLVDKHARLLLEKDSYRTWFCGPSVDTSSLRQLIG